MGANARNDQLLAQLEESRGEKKELIAKTQNLEAEYKGLLSNRDDIIRQQSKIIDEQLKTIDGYESSFRLLGRLSVQVTSKKIRAVGGSVRRLLTQDGKGKDAS